MALAREDHRRKDDHCSGQPRPRALAVLVALRACSALLRA
jgi:hypothetical protein